MLSRRALEVLTILADVERIVADLDDDFEIDLVSEGTVVWLGGERLRWATLEQLVRCCAVSDTSEGGSVQRWIINGTGRAIVRRPELHPEVLNAISAGQPFRIVDDRVDLIHSPK